MPILCNSKIRLIDFDFSLKKKINRPFQITTRQVYLPTTLLPIVYTVHNIINYII